jgi:dihydropteroate synthase
VSLSLRLRDRVVELEAGEPLVMGIVNASPESFSDGSRVGGLDAQVELGLRLREEGADLIDVGGESGVSDRPPVDSAEEAARVVPLVERLSAAGVAVSVDTWKAGVAGAAIEAGAAMINDVSGLIDAGVADACAESGAGLVIMHTRVQPKRKEFPGYDDVMADVVAFLRERIAFARERGVAEDQVVIDPGPDFAKTPAETVDALRRLAELQVLGRPVLLAASRKDFVGAINGRAPGERLAGTLAAVGEGVDAGATILRVHDVAATRDFLRVRATLRGERDVPSELRLDPALRRAPEGRS